MDDFERMFTILLDEEGGYSSTEQAEKNSDPGGETNFGITMMALRPAIEQGLVPASTTIKTLTVDQAKIIYKALYWDAVKGDQLPWPLCAFVFDAAVNQGVQPAIKMLQRALNRAQDGILGAQTISAAVNARPWHMRRFMAFRAMRYSSTRNADANLEGWLVRIFGLAMAVNTGG